MREPGQSLERGRVLFVVNPMPTHIGGHFLRAAEELGVDHRLCDLNLAFRGPWWLNQINWRLRGHRPTHLESFGRSVVNRCRQFRPRALVVTGLLPLSPTALKEIGKLGVARINYLTDDPWNPAHRSERCLSALAEYDWAFTPRLANREDLQRAGCGRVEYLPFAYEPSLHFVDPPSAAERSLFASDLMFAGGCDPDRLPFVRAAVSAGLEVALYGGYWKRIRDLRGLARGLADPPTLRKAIRTTRLNLCLVRRANRDGHSMRTFEIPAIGGCMLAERTDEHEAILGRDGETVSFFSTPEEMLEKARWLLSREQERTRMAEALHQRIVQGRNTYRDRLASLLEAAGLRLTLDKAQPHR